MTALSESFYLKTFPWPISTPLLFSRIGKPILDTLETVCVLLLDLVVALAKSILVFILSLEEKFV